MIIRLLDQRGAKKPNQKRRDPRLFQGAESQHWRVQPLDTTYILMLENIASKQQTANSFFFSFKKPTRAQTDYIYTNRICHWFFVSTPPKKSGTRCEHWPTWQLFPKDGRASVVVAGVYILMDQYRS